jgi:arylsulfatase A-like enzyme
MRDHHRLAAIVGRAGSKRVLVGVVGAALLIGLLIAREADSDQHGSGSPAPARLAARPPQKAQPQADQPAPASTRRPNIVFVLTDDLSNNLIRYMPAVQRLEQSGMTFDHYFVSDSLCCPSRASIFTGNFPHDTGVLSNQGPNGGFGDFHRRGDENSTFATALQSAGYRTAMMGKFLNGYLDKQEGDDGVPDNYVPPGWNEWDVAGWGYPEFDYQMNEDGTIHDYGDQPQDYLTDVIAHKGVDFINSSAASNKPFFLELATFAPHSPYTPAPRYANSFPGVTAPEPPNFNVLPANAPSWLAGRPALDADQIAQIDSAFRLRVQSVQAVDDMISSVEQALAANGLSNNTYIVFSSDNGLHMGEYRLMPGKMTAFDTDIHVPLVVAGPGVPAGTHTDAMAENIDLAKTFSAIGGTTLPSDGHSLLGLLHGGQPTDWRNAILIEHHGPNLNPLDPDFQYSISGNPISYEAMRTDQFLYVEYANGEREFYDLLADPFELNNISSELSPAELAQLHAELLGMENCHTGSACWAAMHVGSGASLTTDLRRREQRTGGYLRHERRTLARRRRHHLSHHLRHHRRKLQREGGTINLHSAAVTLRDRRHDRQPQT